ncbi:MULTISPECIES: YncE family protein [unclassified Crossiella]|uniref:YncE family protein n=1 Tax=unclassified Crossiella TaxID=2620835 RepID=UPI001FFEE5AF|nr:MULTISPECIES: hypothetical protein [unclassified Crossiella]MCK2237558.1 hypothetical protein [Crossiella sp. S99.2]MCK2254844.1 hypothetical protein [Crossiella sp. S99.1]
MLKTLTAVATALAMAASAAPAVAAPSGARVLVADQRAATVHVLDPATGRVTGSLPDRVVNDHAGVVTLPDGRAIFVDDRNHVLVVLQLSGTPKVLGTAPVDGEVAHLTVDPAGGYAVVSSAAHHEHEEPAAPHEEGAHLTLVDLRTWQTKEVPVAAGEPGVLIDAATDSVLLRNDEPAAVQAFPRRDLLAHTGEAPLSPARSAEIGAHGHGEAFSARHRVIAAATERGLDLLPANPDGTFGSARTVPWNISGRTGGRAFYLRLADDSRTVASYVRDDRALDWTQWTEDAYLANATTGEAHRVPLGTGYLYRFGLSDTLAGYLVQGGRTDELVLVDLATAKVTGRVDLGTLPGGPQGGTDPFTAQGRRVALTDDGGRAFVTAGGQGRVDVVDTRTKRVCAELKLPTALSGGGSVAVWEPGVRHADLVGR